MTWVAQSLVSIDLTELSQRINERRQPASLVERMYAGTVTVEPEGSLILFGSSGGVYDSMLEMVTFLALFPVGRMHVYASGVTLANQPAVVEPEGVFFVAPGRLFHVVLANPSTTDNIDVQFFLGGDAAE